MRSQLVPNIRVYSVSVCMAQPRRFARSSAVVLGVKGPGALAVNQMIGNSCCIWSVIDRRKAIGFEANAPVSAFVLLYNGGTSNC